MGQASEALFNSYIEIECNIYIHVYAIYSILAHLRTPLYTCKYDFYPFNEDHDSMITMYEYVLTQCNETECGW